MPETKTNIKPVKPICGVLFSESVDLNAIDAKLQSSFGPIDVKSPVFHFSFTRYYDDEMGTGLKKMFYSFENLMAPDDLAAFKNATISVEMEFAKDGKRTVNLDPGYLEESKLVLASTKNFSHRVYLRDGVWAEVTLRYAHGEFVTHPWTYPDYSQDLAIDFFKSVREAYRRQLESV